MPTKRTGASSANQTEGKNMGVELVMGRYGYGFVLDKS